MILDLTFFGSILLADEYSFSVAKADEGVSKDDGEPFQVLDVKIKAPYKKMLMVSSMVSLRGIARVNITLAEWHAVRRL